MSGYKIIQRNIGKKTLYHGMAVDNKNGLGELEINYSFSSDRSDFGKGFYLTTNIELAKRRAKAKFNIKMDSLEAVYGSLEEIPQAEMPIPIVKCFSLDYSELECLDILAFEQYSDEWLNYVINKKKILQLVIKTPYPRLLEDFSTDLLNQAYDIVYGPLVDGTPKLYSIIKQYIEHKNKEQLLIDIQRKFDFPVQDQISIHSDRAKKVLKFIYEYCGKGDDDKWHKII